MSSNIIVILSRNELAPTRLLSSPDVGEISVITEEGGPQQVGDDVDVHRVSSVTDVDQVRKAALAILAKRDIDQIVAPFEMAVPAAAFLRTYLGLPGMGYETSVAFANKYVMKSKLAAGGLPVAAHRVAYSFDDVRRKADELGWPIVVKPALGWGSRNIEVLSDAEQFEVFRRTAAADDLVALGVPLIVEEMLDIQREYHVDGIVHAGEVRFASASAYFAPMLDSHGNLGSYFLAADDPHRAEVEQLHRDVVAALGLRDGVTHLELFATTKGLMVGEIGCRPGGGGIPAAIYLQHGINLWDAFAKVSLGLKPELCPIERADIVAHYYLPLRAGRITRISDSASLASISSVFQVDMTRGVGDTASVVTPTSTAGVVYFRVDHVDEIKAVMQEITDVYELEVDNQ